MIRLTKNQLLRLQEELVTETGGAAGIWDERLLDSALSLTVAKIGFDELFQ